MYNKRNSKSNSKLPKITSSPNKSPDKNKNKSVKPEEKINKLTATAYAVYDTNLQLIAGTRLSIKELNSNAKREIASLTKMMTMFCTVRLCEKYKINMKKCYFRVTINAAGTRGTSA